MVRNLAVLPMLAAILAGCASFHNEPISPEVSASAFEARRLDSPQVKAFLETGGQETTAWPPPVWRLDELALAACYFHPDLQVAQAQWRTAEAAIITARQHPNPTLGLTPQYDISASGGLSPWVVGVPLEFPIETAGRRGYRVAQASELSAAAQRHVAAVAWQVRSRVRTRLLDLDAALQREKLLKEELTLQEQTVRLLQGRLKHGEISQVEFDQGRIPRDQARLSLLETQQRTAESRVALAGALGVPPAALEGIELSFACVEELPAEVPSAEARRDALLTRPDLLASLSEYATAQSALQLEIARQYPNFSLGPSYEFDQGENKWGLRITATLPVFNQNEGPIAEAEAKRKQAAARFETLQIGVIGQVAQALVRYSQGLNVLKQADDILAQRTAQEKAAHRRFEAGEIDRLELLATKLGRNAAALARLDAFVRQQQALGLLEDAVMRPLVCEGTTGTPAP